VSAVEIKAAACGGGVDHSFCECEPIARPARSCRAVSAVEIKAAMILSSSCLLAGGAVRPGLFGAEGCRVLNLRLLWSRGRLRLLGRIVNPGAFRNDRVRVVSGANLCPVDPSIDGDLSWITSKYMYDVIKDNVVYKIHIHFVI
jgi:hypothetical protein